MKIISIWWRTLLLNFARKLAAREGLTLADIRNADGQYYIVAHTASGAEVWYLIRGAKGQFK